MKRISAFASLAILVAIAATAICGTVAEDVCKPYWEVRSQGSIGSGTALKIGDEVLVLTCGHVVESSRKKTTRVIVGEDGKERQVEVAAWMPITLRREGGGKQLDLAAKVCHYSPAEEDGGMDLALVRPDDAKEVGAVAATGFDAKLEQGLDCWYVGTPHGIHGVLEKATLVKLDIKAFDREYLCAGGLGYRGNSGGGLFVKREDGTHVLVGVCCRMTGAEKQIVLFHPPGRVKSFVDDYLESKKCGCCRKK